MTTTPAKPTAMPMSSQRVIFSPRKTVASSATMIGPICTMSADVPASMRRSASLRARL